jgi:hypothetical protein
MSSPASGSNGGWAVSPGNNSEIAQVDLLSIVMSGRRIKSIG